MNKVTHRIYIGTMVIIVIGITLFISYSGYSYYTLPLEERFYHPQYAWFKPSGIFGQGLGIVGTFLILFGVSIYILRKRYGVLQRWIRLKYLLEFHIFLCTLGPILILFHTTFKFGGIVSIAFWSMVAVVISGVIGRFIYIQIPRSIEGRELSVSEIQSRRSILMDQISTLAPTSSQSLSTFFQSDENHKWGLSTFVKNRRRKKELRKALKKTKLGFSEQLRIVEFAAEEMSLSSKISRLQNMQRLFKYWHVVHMPFAIIMVIIVLIHVGVTLTLGYKWIF